MLSTRRGEPIHLRRPVRSLRATLHNCGRSLESVYAFRIRGRPCGRLMGITQHLLGAVVTAVFAAVGGGLVAWLGQRRGE